MLKLKGYLKPFIGIMILEVILLFTQAFIELNLPKYMSEIVNTGLQQWGIESVVPEVIDLDSLNSIEAVLTPEEFTQVSQAYVPVSEELSDFPLAKELGALELVKGSDVEQLESIFLKAADDEQVKGIYFVKNSYEILGADINEMQLEAIIQIGMVMLLLTIAGVLAAMGVGFFASRVGAGVAKNLREDVFTHVTSFTGSEFDQFGTASLITRTTNDITQMQQFLTMGIRMVCFAPVMGIGGLVMAIRTAPSMTWVLGIGIACVLVIIVFLFKYAIPKFKLIQKLVDKLNLIIRENLTGMLVIRAFATQKQEEERFDKTNQELKETNLFVNRATGFMMPGMTFIMNAMMLLVIWVGSKEIANSQILVGDMMAFMQYGMEVIMSFIMVSMMFIFIPRASVSGQRIYEILNTKSSIVDAKDTKSFPKSPKGVLSFEQVSFRYAGAEEDVLEDLNFTAKPGETTAIIGSTGSGKSTLVNLIPRFYDVTAGKITLDGVDIRQLKQHELREYLGFVPQKGMLFSGTIGTNLRFAKEEANQDELEAAAEIAQAKEFISTKKDGFDANISQGGTNVSGGQRQRLAIARALVKKAPIYIFDDSFSALDFKTDAALRKSLAEKVQDATVMIVAQRISTIMNAEQILVLDEGKIVGKGTHRELLNTCETYREIALSQLSKEELGL